MIEAKAHIGLLCVQSLQGSVDNPRLQGDELSHRNVIMDAAVVCERLWMQFGTWLNHERSLYLCALTFNRFGQWQSALDSAGKALVIIESNGVEEVDRAFLLLQVSKACQGLGNRGSADEALHAADRIAQGFDSQLSRWFLDVRSKLKVADFVPAD